MSQNDNIIIQVRAHLQSRNIKLWLEPYYLEDKGSVDAVIDILSEDFSQSLNISKSKCKLALVELQASALKKLSARKEYEITGLATLTVRRVSGSQGTENIVEVKCDLTSLGRELQGIIAKAFDIADAERIKCISAGRIINSDRTLLSQGIKNNQQLMAIVSEVDRSDQLQENSMYDRIRKIKMDVEAIVDSDRQLFEMEDQDGNAVFLPPMENRAILMAMGFYEKARVALKHERFDEALILLLEADEKFTNCNSKFLESVDNYALVNLDIVWCYLRLKNVSQLPDAERRLEICEKNFHRSYGKNLERLLILKGSDCLERVLLMRLHLLQGVVLFHKNQRNAAYEKFIMAENELRELKVDENTVSTLIEMGYEPYDARLSLRACRGNVEQAINFIHDRNAKLKEARKRSKKERHLHDRLGLRTDNDGNWVNPRSVYTLTEMGYSTSLVIEALHKANNDLSKALDFLQNHSVELSQSLPTPRTADNSMMEQLLQLGFRESHVRLALESTYNNMDRTLEFLIQMHHSENDLRALHDRIQISSANQNVPTTSSGINTLYKQFLDKLKNEIESLQAYKRFREDTTINSEYDYLDLPLVHEEQFLQEYKNLLEQ